MPSHLAWAEKGTQTGLEPSSQAFYLAALGAMEQTDLNFVAPVCLSPLVDLPIPLKEGDRRSLAPISPPVEEEHHPMLLNDSELFGSFPSVPVYVNMDCHTPPTWEEVPGLLDMPSPNPTTAYPLIWFPTCSSPHLEPS